MNFAPRVPSGAAVVGISISLGLHPPFHLFHYAPGRTSGCASVNFPLGRGVSATLGCLALGHGLSRCVLVLFLLLFPSGTQQRVGEGNGDVGKGGFARRVLGGGRKELGAEALGSASF